MVRFARASVFLYVDGRLTSHKVIGGRSFHVDCGGLTVVMNAIVLGAVVGVVYLKADCAY